MAGERIAEAIDVADLERRTWKLFDDERAESTHPGNIPPPARHPLLAALDLTPERYVLNTVEKVRSTELFDALLVLPFGKVISLLEYLNEWALRVSSSMSSLRTGFQSYSILKKPCHCRNGTLF
jgi:U3 small nucleolar RNA-associated protein 12